MQHEVDIASEVNSEREKKLKHVKVYDILYTQIKEGLFPVGSKLPSEPELAVRMGVSRMTLRRALALLQEDNLVENIRGKGNYIKANKLLPNSGMEYICHPIQTCCMKNYDSVELELRLELPTEAIVESLKSQCAAVVIVDRWYLCKKVPVAYTLTFVPIEVISARQLNLSTPDMIQHYLEHTIYTNVTDSILHITHSTAGNFTSRKYLLSQNDSFELIHETLYHGKNNVVAYNKHYIPSSAFQMNVHGIQMPVH